MVSRRLELLLHGLPLTARDATDDAAAEDSDDEMGAWIWRSSRAAASRTTARTALPVPVRAAARVLTADGGDRDEDAGAALANAVGAEGRAMTPAASEPPAREMRTLDGAEGGENRSEREGKAVPSKRKMSARDGDGTGPRKTPRKRRSTH